MKMSQTWFHKLTCALEEFMPQGKQLFKMPQKIFFPKLYVMKSNENKKLEKKISQINILFILEILLEIPRVPAVSYTFWVFPIRSLDQLLFFFSTLSVS